METDNTGGTENFGCLYYNSTSKTLEDVAGSRHEGVVSSLGIPLTNFTAAAFNGPRGLIFLSDACTAGYDYALKT